VTSCCQPAGSVCACVVWVGAPSGTHLTLVLLLLPCHSFKERGALNALLLMDRAAKERGAIAASAGESLVWLVCAQDSSPFTHSQSRSLWLTRTLARVRSLAMPRSHTLTLSHSHTLTLSHSHTHTLTLTLSRSHTLTLSHSDARALYLCALCLCICMSASASPSPSPSPSAARWVSREPCAGAGVPRQAAGHPGHRRHARVRAHHQGSELQGAGCHGVHPGRAHRPVTRHRHDNRQGAGETVTLRVAPSMHVEEQ
jgi:hypothetical protein